VPHGLEEQTKNAPGATAQGTIAGGAGGGGRLLHAGAGYGMIERACLAFEILGAVGRHGEAPKSRREFPIKGRECLLSGKRGRVLCPHGVEVAEHEHIPVEVQERRRASAAPA
jgi:hypothetical protein